MIEKLDESVALSPYRVAEKINEIIDAYNNLEKRYNGHMHHARELQYGTAGPISFDTESNDPPEHGRLDSDTVNKKSP